MDCPLYIIIKIKNTCLIIFLININFTNSSIFPRINTIINFL